MDDGKVEDGAQPSRAEHAVTTHVQASLRSLNQPDLKTKQAAKIRRPTPNFDRIFQRFLAEAREIAVPRELEAEVPVPYRSSTLTWVLRHILGGNFKTMVLLACAPTTAERLVTERTLKFGMRCCNLPGVSAARGAHARLVASAQRVAGGFCVACVRSR